MLNNLAHFLQPSGHSSKQTGNSTHKGTLISVDKLTKFAIDYTRERLYKNILSSCVGTDNDQAYFNVNIEDLYLREDLTNNINNE